jgi:hypothetical protein
MAKGKPNPFAGKQAPPFGAKGGKANPFAKKGEGMPFKKGGKVKK